jgi:hypothetical protein
MILRTGNVQFALFFAALTHFDQPNKNRFCVGAATKMSSSDQSANKNAAQFVGGGWLDDDCRLARKGGRKCENGTSEIWDEFAVKVEKG